MTSPDTLLAVDRAKTNYGKRRISFIGSQLWNKLEPSIKNIKSLLHFKKELKKWLFVRTPACRILLSFNPLDGFPISICSVFPFFLFLFSLLFELFLSTYPHLCIILFLSFLFFLVFSALCFTERSLLF